jgi:hypothetical protein
VAPRIGSGDVAIFLVMVLVLSACVMVPLFVLMRRSRRARGADGWYDPNAPLASRRPWPAQQRVGNDPRPRR